MAVHIRLARAGTTKVPYYRIVAADQRSARGGRFIERLGSWDPRRSAITLDRVRVGYWLQHGAKASATVAKLLKQAAAAAAAVAAVEPEAGTTVTGKTG
jgi:small subunit ribosomal protein S16